MEGIETAEKMGRERRGEGRDRNKEQRVRGEWGMGKRLSELGQI